MSNGKLSSLKNWNDHYILNLGCGNTRVPHGINVDILPEVKPDKEWDLNKLPLPWEDNKFDRVIMSHIFEHLGDSGETGKSYLRWFAEFWREIWRVLKDRGWVEMTVPYGQPEQVWGDPSHVRPLFPLTFLVLSKKMYSQMNTMAPNPLNQFGMDYDFDIDVKVHQDAKANPLFMTVRMQALKDGKGEE